MYGSNKISSLITIAGSDNGGGAGIQADIKTCCAFKVYAASVITAVTAQNSNGVRSILPIPTEMLRDQIDTIFESMSPRAIKIGMLPSAEAVATVSERLKHYKAKNIVVDPVLIASSGNSLAGRVEDTLSEMKASLFPIADIVTPNIPEAYRICGREDFVDLDDLCKYTFLECGAKAILLKGGHAKENYCTDILHSESIHKHFNQYRIETENTHGTGCALSSAIACGLANGLPLVKAVRAAKDFISYAIHEAANTNIQKGNGPLYLFGKS